jgi:hypothetical protein
MRQHAAFVGLADFHAQAVGAVQQVVGGFFEQEHGAGLPAFGAAR